MKTRIIKHLSKRIALLSVGVLLFGAGVVYAVDGGHQTVNLKTADQKQIIVPGSNTSTVKAATNPPAQNQPTPAVTDTPDATPSDTPQSNALSTPSDSADSTPADTTQTPVTPPAPTLVSQVITNDEVTQTGPSTWTETASCLYTYSDGSTNTTDLGTIQTRSVAFAAPNEGRNCQNLI